MKKQLQKAKKLVYSSCYSLRGGHTANFCFNSGQVSFKSIIMRRRYNRLVFHLSTTRLYYLPCSYTVNHKISWRALNQEINCKVILDTELRLVLTNTWNEQSSNTFLPVLLLLLLLLLSWCGTFQLSVESNPELLWFCSSLLCDWSTKLQPLSQPIRCKAKTNHDLISCVFPRFKQFARFYFEFSLAI